MLARSLPVLTLLGAILVSRAAAADHSPNEAPPADRPVREGFTLELGIGPAVMFVSQTYSTAYCSTGCFRDSTESKVFGGFAPLSLGIGGFLSENVALLFRAASTWHPDEDKWDSQLIAAFIDPVLQFATVQTRDDDDGLVSAFYGPIVEFWASDRWMFAAGAGLACVSGNATTTRSTNSRSSRRPAR